MDVPDNGTDSANRSVTADSVKTVFQSDGKHLKRAEAVGDAEFVSTPHRQSAENYALRTNAERFECDFYRSRNDPQTCVALNGTKTVRTPTVQRHGRGEQTIFSSRLSLVFDDASRAIARLDAEGKAKFTELDRTAIADTFSFASANEVVQLRGGEPTAWDSTARMKAKEIDWDTRNGRSAFRGGVSSTYYSTRSVGSAAPFGDDSKPFYVTAQSAEMDHQNEIGLFTGNARGWQASNYVRGERLELRKRESQLNAFGGVQSLLYNARKTKGDNDASVPVSAAAAEMHYDGKGRSISYGGGVDIRQGTDRMTGGAAFIQLNERNEMSQTKVDSNVAILQAGRKAYGEGFVYTASDDRLFLRGRPARVEDPERGSSQGEELVIYLSDNRMAGEGRSKANPSGRVRNIYKVN
jgi:lipopolysaccharide export system protein LptA